MAAGAKGRRGAKTEVKKCISIAASRGHGGLRSKSPKMLEIINLYSKILIMTFFGAL